MALKNNFSADYTIYLNHVNNNGGKPDEKWKKVANSFIEPIVLLFLLGGLSSILLTVLMENQYIKDLFMIGGAMCWGLGLHYFIYYFNKANEYQYLKNKAENTVRNLNLSIKNLLRKDHLSNEDKNSIDILINTIDFWKDYYPMADPYKNGILRKLKEEIRIENFDIRDMEKTPYSNLANIREGNGLSSYIPPAGMQL